MLADLWESSFLRGCLGVLTLLGAGYLFSENRKNVAWTFLLKALSLQVLIGVLLVGIPSRGWEGPLTPLFNSFNQMMVTLVGYSEEGAGFLFGDLGRSDKYGFIFAFRVLPTIIFFSSLMSVLYHLGWMQWVVKGMAFFVRRTLKVSGVEALVAVAEVFLGQTESPLLVKPYLKNMTRSELFCLMTGGLATVAGGVLAAYVGVLFQVIPGIGGHLLAASFMAAPGSLLFGKLLVPESRSASSQGTGLETPPSDAFNLIDAAAHGAAEGTKLAINVAGMLIAFISLIALLNGFLEAFGSWSGLNAWIGAPLRFEWILGWIFRPVAWLVGVTYEDSLNVGMLIGKKLVLNEFVAYLDLAQMSQQISSKSQIMASYALCGFANFASIAIQLGGTGSLIPERRSEMASLGLKALLAGTLTSLLNATIIGMWV